MTDLKNPSLPEKWIHTPVPGNEEQERLHPPKDDWEQIERYRDRYIGKHATGTITVRKQGDPCYGEFIIALDDSKMHGNRREIPGANTIENARAYIDRAHDGPGHINHQKEEPPMATQKPKYEVFVDPKTEKVYGDSHFKIGLLKENVPSADYEKMLAGHTRREFTKAADAKAFVADQQEKAAAKGHTPPDPNRPLTDRQIEIVGKFGSAEAKAALAAGDNAAARKHLDAQLKEWEEKKNAPLTDKQRELVTRYGTEQAREALAKGDNAAARSALTGIIRDWEEKKKTPPTEKQHLVIEKYGTPELKEAVNGGDYRAARLFIREKASELDRRPLTEKQLTFLHRIADKETLEKVQGGDHKLGRKFLSDFNRSVTAEVVKWQERNPEHKTPAATAELKKAEYLLRLNGLESHRELAYGQVAKEGRSVQDLVAGLREKAPAPEKAKSPSGPEK